MGIKPGVVDFFLMNLLGLSLRGARFYWRTHAGVLVGCALAASVLVGAMLVGDSVRYSLRQFALQRLGDTEAAIQSPTRFFSDELAALVAKEAGVRTAPALQLRGVAIRPGRTAAEDRRANRIQVLGVDERFWTFAEGRAPDFGEDGVVLSRKLALTLGAQVGDEISLRIGKPTLMPRDAPLSSRKEGLSVRNAYVVRAIVPDAQLGRFSLMANQVAPYNAFVPLRRLQTEAGLPGRASLLLAASRPGGAAVAPDALNAALRKVWRPEHVGVSLREFPALGVVQLESDRVFLDPALARAALASGGEGAGPRPAGVFTYLANGITKEGEGAVRSTPYSFVNALTPSANRRLGLVPPDMKDDEILVNRWLADHLALKPGDAVRMAYYELTPSNQFVEKTRTFRVRGVVAMEDLAGERDLMPKFPGLTDVNSCREWDIGMPMEEERLRDEANEAYWKTYRQTPKALVTLKSGEEMWANRFGNLSAVRYAAEAGAADGIRERLIRDLDPANLGLLFLPVREPALRAVSQAMDFGELFLSMSFFLIVAALMLTGLLFVFGVQQRAREMGTLLAVGYRPGHVRFLFLLEGGAVALAGSVLGGFLGTLYTRGLLWGLAHHWQAAVANSAIRYHAEPQTLAIGIASSFVCAILAIGVSLWRQSRRSAWDLLSSDFRSDPKAALAARGRGLAGLWISLVAVAAGGALVGYGFHAEEHAVAVFFGAGVLFLAGGMGLARFALKRLSAPASRRLTVTGLGIRSAARRRGRSLAAVGLLASGCFLVLSVLSMKEDVTAHADRRSSGTGGFALYAESTLAIPGDLNTGKAKEAFALQGETLLDGVQFVSVKVHDGDSADCFNLNRAQSPRLLGLDPDAFGRRAAFLPEGSKENVWDLLKTRLPDGSVPGLVGDADTAQYTLGKKVGVEKGDRIFYTDERGNGFHVKLVGRLPLRLSVFQGVILIAAADFTEKFPSEDGYRMFLADVPPGRAAQVQAVLASKLDRVGLDIGPAAERLKEFSAVQSTYLGMFVVLGGMGLLLGSAGLGIVVLRNVMERRGELALLRAVGYRRSTLSWMLLSEHLLLLAAGLVCGAFAAVVAVLPALLTPGADVSFVPVAATLAGVTLNGLVWVLLACRGALRGDLIPALRSE